MSTLDDLDVEGKRVLVRVDFNVPLDEDRASPTTRASAPRCRRSRSCASSGARLAAGRAPRAAEGPRARAVAARPSPSGWPSCSAPTSQLAERPRRRARRRRRDARERPLRAGRDQERPRAGRSATPRWPTSTSTTRSAPRTARTPRPRRSRSCCRAPPGGCSSARSRRCSGILDDPQRPLVAIVGGAKVTDKIGVLDAFLERADAILDRRRDVLPVLQGPGPRGRRLAVRGGGRRARARACSTRGADKLRAAGRPRRRPRSSTPTPSARELDGVDVPDGWMGLDVGPAHRRALRAT